MFECQFSMFLSSLNDWFHLLLYGVTGEQMTWSCVTEASAGLNSCASWFKENLADFCFATEMDACEPLFLYKFGVLKRGLDHHIAGKNMIQAWKSFK